MGEREGRLERQVFEVAIAIISENGRYLATRRNKDVHLPGLWEFPGGKRLPSETLEECLLREVREELGVSVKIERAFYRIEHDYPDRKIILQSYLCRLLAGTPRPLASQECRWMAPPDLLSHPFPEANAPLLKKLIEE